MLRPFFPPQHGQLQLFYCCKYTSKIDSHNLLLDEESLSCFLPCANEIRPGPDLQCSVVTIASRSNYVEYTAQCSLSVQVQQTLHWFYHTKHTDRNHYAIIITFIVKKQPINNFRSNLFCATLYSIPPCLSF